jgi:hypothetical protein
MAISVVIHFPNSEPILCEIEELPNPSDQTIVIQNPRHTDGKDLNFIMEKVVTVIWPINRINFIEILPSEDEEDIIGFVRE